MEQEKRIVPVHATPELLSEMESLVIRGGSTATPQDTNTNCSNAKCGAKCDCTENPDKGPWQCGIFVPNAINLCNS